MDTQQLWLKEFDTAKAEGFTPLQAGMLADVKVRDYESAAKHAAALQAQKEAAAYHSLSVRDNAIDRQWAARLSSE
jgi:hypothetical protein